MQSTKILENYFRKVNMEQSADKLVFYERCADSGKFLAVVAFPIYEEAREYDKIISYNRPAGEVIQASYLGDYSTIDKVHVEMQQYLRDQHLATDGPCFEQFVRDTNATDKIIVTYYLEVY